MSNSENEIFTFEKDDASSSRLSSGECKRVTHIGGIRGESSADFVLPDYMGDIKKLLKSCAQLCVANKFIGNGEVSFLIMVTYRVAYLDGDERLTEATFTSDYECTQKTASGFIDADITPLLQGLTVRLQGPRKICAKVGIISEIDMVESDVISEAAEIQCAESKTRKIKVHGCEFLNFAEREYAEQIGRIDSVASDEIEIIKSDASLNIESCRRGADELNISGSIDAFCLLRVDDDIVRVEKKIPFEDSMAFYDEGRECSFTACGYLTSISASVNTSVGDDAEAGMLYSAVVMNMTLECRVTCNYNAEHKIISDAFVKGKKNECSYKDFCYDELSAPIFEKKKITLCRKRDEIPIRNVLDSDLKIKNCKYMIANSDLIISSDAEYNIIAGGMNPGECVSIKGEEPIEERIKISDFTATGGKFKALVDICTSDVQISFDGESIYVSFSLCVLGCVCEEKVERVLTSLEVVNADRSSGRKVIVYYPEENDTLWSVAKKYATGIFDIEKYNSAAPAFSSDDPDAPLGGVDKILIVLND